MQELKQLKQLATQINSLQDEFGVIVGDETEAKRLLLESKDLLVSLSKKIPDLNNIQCIVDDINDWLRTGLSQRPEFKRTSIDLLKNVQRAKDLVFIGPYRTANSGARRGFRFEYFYAKLESNDLLTKYQKLLPHPCDKTVPARLKDGTPALFEGNNVVFFPEGISSSYGDSFQNFALFFFDKFRRIYQEKTLPIVQKVLGDTPITQHHISRPSATLSEESMYDARCLWGYIHDLHHFKGPRPFSNDIGLKVNWALGLLEEVKVDCQTALYLHDNPHTDYAHEIFEFILFERLFRYPSEPDCEDNFDSGTGVFMFNYFNNQSVFEISNSLRTVNTEKLVTAMRELVTTILHMESLPDREYLDKGRDLVYSYLTRSQTNRFKLNPEYLAFVA